MREIKEYQQDIVNQVISTNASTLIQLPTGSGKTFIAKLIALELTSKDQRVLFVTPQENLLEQTMEEFKSLRPQKVHGPLKYDPHHLISISTNHTAKNRKDLQPHVIIVDEIHYGYSGKMLAELKEANPNSRIIGLSATPYDSDGVLLKGFDIVLDDYDVKYMIEHNHLVDVEAYTAVRKGLHEELSKIRNIIAGDYAPNELDKLMGNPQAVLEVVNATKEHIEKSKKTIVFAVNIKHAELLTEAYKKAGFSSEILHSKIDKKLNKEVVERFRKGYIKILISVNMITTGFDVPDTDMAVIARPTKSQNLYKQMVGRIMRTADNKTHATLLDCGGVIKNLGNPTDPIQERVKSERGNGKHLCSFCASERLSPKNINEKIYWVCSECGGKKEAKEARIYQCESCNKYHGRNANLSMDQEALLLICECGHHTVISTPYCDETLIQVIDPKRKIEIITNRVIREYTALIRKHYGAEKVTAFEIKNHIRQIKLKIQRDPNEFLELDLENIINQDNKFIPLVEDEYDALFKNMAIIGKEINETYKVLQISTIDILEGFNKHYLANPENINGVFDEINIIIINFHKTNHNGENHVLLLNKLLYELHYLKVWQDFYILLSIEMLLALARLFQTLIVWNEEFYHLSKEYVQKTSLQCYHLEFGEFPNFLNQLNSKNIEKNFSKIESLNNLFQENFKSFCKNNLDYDDEDIENLLEYDDEGTNTFYTAYEQIQRSYDVQNEVEKGEANRGHLNLDEYIIEQGRFIKNSETAMQFVTLLIEEYNIIGLELNFAFNNLNTRIQQITNDSKIKYEHQTLLLRLNEKVFSFKKFNLWHDSFLYLSYKNFEAILGLFTILGENLEKSIHYYNIDHEEIDAKTLATQMRLQFHNIENKAYEVWKANYPQDEQINLLKKSKNFRQLFNETMKNQIILYEKILS